MKTPAKRWEFPVGMKPYRVTAFEDLKRGGIVHVRWTVRGKRTIRSLGFTVRGSRGGLDQEQVARAIQIAAEQHTALVQGRGVVSATPEPVAAPLAIRDGWKHASDPATGKWIHETPHRKDIERAITRAEEAWGPATTWNAVDRGHLRKLWRFELARQRALGRRGVRAAQLTLDLVLAVGSWLRDEQLILPTAAMRWRQMDAEFAADVGEYKPLQPRYTPDEYRMLFPAAWKADERFGFAYSLGAEYRLGQVVRSRRLNLELDKKRLRIPGKGKKHGGVIVFTAQQWADVQRVLSTGYLAGLEAAFQSGTITDFPLFPGGPFAHGAEGQLVSRAEYATREHVDRTAVLSWHARAEEIAGVPHVPGRGPYGARRTGVDLAKAERISREGLRESGGWANQQMPDNVYADSEADYARDEAAEVRARIRGELPTNTEESSQIVTPNESVSPLKNPSQS